MRHLVRRVPGKFSFHSLRVPQPRVWSLQTPQLHTLRLSTFGAETIERFGLRLWGTSRGRLTLNGEEAFDTEDQIRMKYIPHSM